MDRRRVLNVVAILLVAALAGVALVAAGVVGPPVSAPPDDSYEWTTVTVRDEDGTQLGELEVRLADTGAKRYTGLSNTTSMPEDEGMLFTYDSERDLTYVMRGMDFGIDIVYVDAEGVITSIHHAPEPPEGADGNEFRYSGTGQYVLEVNLHWTTRHGVAVGDRIVVGEGTTGATDPADTPDRVDDSGGDGTDDDATGTDNGWEVTNDDTAAAGGAGDAAGPVAAHPCGAR